MPELRDLRAFVTLAEERNFTRAAERLFVTQPALSHRVARLERELGLSLFTRTSRQVSLTPAGERFLELARTVLETLDHGLQDLRAQAAPQVLRVGYADYVAHTVIPGRLAELRRGLPGLTLRQIEGTTQEQLAGLRAGTLDLGFFIAGAVRVRGLASRRLWTEAFVLALAQEHPLAAQPEVALRDLSGVRLLLNSRESHPGLYAYFQDVFAQVGATPHLIVNPGARMYSFAGMMRLVAEGEGAFLIVRSMAGLGYPGVVFRPLQDVGIGQPLRLVWRTALPGQFQDRLRAAFPAGR